MNALDIVAAAKAFVVAAGGPQLDANVGHVPQPTLADVAETHSLRAVRRGFQSALPPVVASAKPTKTPSAPRAQGTPTAQATRHRRRRSVVVQIGTLNEGALHAQLKEWYRRPGDQLEQVAGGFVVDLVRGDLLVEIQTGGFAPLRRKLELLAQEHPVRLVAPVPVGRRIVKLSDEGEVLSARRSPCRGRIEDIFSRLVSIPSLLCLPRFELEIVLTHQDELRVHRPGKAFRRRGWVVTGRRLLSVEERRLLATPADAAGLLPLALPELFDTAELAQAAGIERRLAADDLLLAGNGRARRCGQAERRRRPPARGVANG